MLEIKMWNVFFICIPLFIFQLRAKAAGFGLQSGPQIHSKAEANVGSPSCSSCVNHFFSSHWSKNCLFNPGHFDFRKPFK